MLHVAMGSHKGALRTLQMKGLTDCGPALLTESGTSAREKQKHTDGFLIFTFVPFTARKQAQEFTICPLIQGRSPIPATGWLRDMLKSTARADISCLSLGKSFNPSMPQIFENGNSKPL